MQNNLLLNLSGLLLLENYMLNTNKSTSHKKSSPIYYNINIIINL